MDGVKPGQRRSAANPGERLVRRSRVGVFPSPLMVLGVMGFGVLVTTLACTTVALPVGSPTPPPPVASGPAKPPPRPPGQPGRPPLPTGLPQPPPWNGLPPGSPLLGAAAPDTTIRVLLVEAAPAFELALSGAGRVSDPQGRTVHTFTAGFAPSPVLAEPAGLALGGYRFQSAPGSQPAATKPGPIWLDVIANTPGGVVVNGRHYLGRLRVYHDGRTLTAVNHVALDDYLVGVLRGELPGGWQPETYRAQAVASRTFVLYEKWAASTSHRFDVRATVASQVYVGTGPVASESARQHQHLLQWAVETTSGEVLTFAGKLLHSYFHSTCGGTAESATLCWPAEPPVPPLAGGGACGACGFSPRSRWGPLSWTKTALTAKLRAGDPQRFGATFGELRSLAVASRSPRSGRPATLALTGSTGATVELGAYAFRLRVSEGESRDRILPSHDFAIHDAGGQVHFHNGRGFGHGVGLCQYGAEGQARTGRNYREILNHYYPGSALATVVSLPQI